VRLIVTLQSCLEASLQMAALEGPKWSANTWGVQQQTHALWFSTSVAPVGLSLVKQGTDHSYIDQRLLPAYLLS
jgi:hypothetical protein